MDNRRFPAAQDLSGRELSTHRPIGGNQGADAGLTPRRLQPAPTITGVTT